MKAPSRAAAHAVRCAPGSWPQDVNILSRCEGCTIDTAGPQKQFIWNFDA